jgi:hypothetical protein
VAENRLPSSVPVLRRALLWGLLANAGIAIIGGALGALTAGTSGAVSAVIGAAMGFVFLGLTAASMLIAVRFSMVAFFGIVMGTWILKFVLFLVLAFVLRAQPWVSLLALFLALLADCKRLKHQGRLLLNKWTCLNSFQFNEPSHCRQLSCRLLRHHNDWVKTQS